MSTIVAKNLGLGQLPNSVGDLYVPGAGVTAHVHNIVIYNDNTINELVVINHNDGANNYCIFKATVVPNDTVILSFPNEGIVLLNSGGDKITGNTTTASKVTYDINGSEES